MKLKIKFGFAAFFIAVLFGFILYLINISPIKDLLPNWFQVDGILLSFHPALFMFVGGGGIATLLAAIGYTFVIYFMVGFIAGFIYQWLGKYSKKLAILILVLIPLLYVGFIIRSHYKEYRAFHHLDVTVEDCAKLELSIQGPCYRHKYRQHSVPEVCNYPGLNKAENMECAKRYGAQSGKLENCSQLNEKRLRDYCKWGVAFINKDINLCRQLPDDDRFTPGLSPQDSCVTVINNYWDRSVDFWLNPVDYRAN